MTNLSITITESLTLLGVMAIGAGLGHIVMLLVAAIIRAVRRRRFINER